jgi:hypothetical protein
MSSIMRWRNGLLGLSIIAKTPVSHGVEPHDFETGQAPRITYSGPTISPLLPRSGFVHEPIPEDGHFGRQRQEVAPMLRSSLPSKRRSVFGRRHWFVRPTPYFRLWREAGGQTSIRAAAICALELRSREYRRRRSTATDDPRRFLKNGGRRKAIPTGEL